MLISLRGAEARLEPLGQLAIHVVVLKAWYHLRSGHHRAEHRGIATQLCAEGMEGVAQQIQNEAADLLIAVAALADLDEFAPVALHGRSHRRGDAAGGASQPAQVGMLGIALAVIQQVLQSAHGSPRGLCVGTWEEVPSRAAG